MYKQSIVFLFMLNFLVLEAQAYSWDKCRQKVFDSYGGGSRAITSTTQFVSSWGPCSALGMNKEEQRKIFYYVNFEHIKNDVARGKGETLDTLLSLSSCKNSSDLQVKKELKENYVHFFSEDSEKSYLNVGPVLDSACGESKLKS